MIQSNAGNSTRWKRSLIPLSVTLLIYFFMSISFAIYVPDWQPYDEPFHFVYADKLAREGRAPTFAESSEAHQPPLYYAVASLAITRDAPYEGICLRLRIFTLLMGALMAAALFFAFSRVLKTPLHAALLTTIFMNVPAVLASVSTITNDAAAMLFGALCFWAMVNAWDKSSTTPHVLLGLFAGLALLSKGTCLFLGPVIFVYYALQKTPLKHKLKNAGACLVVTLAIAGWWYARNVILYGDPTGSSAAMHIYERTSVNLFQPGEFVRWLALLFTHFWNCKNYLRNVVPGYPFWVNVVQLAITLLPVAGVIIHVARKRDFRRVSRFDWVMVAAVATLGLEIFANSFRYYMPTGRFMFPATFAIGYLWYRGTSLFMGGKYSIPIMGGVASIILTINLYLVYRVFASLPPMPFDAPF